MNILKLKYIFAVILTALLQMPLKAQTNGDLQITGGLATMWIVNDNVARLSIQPREPEEPFGGAFDGQQLGFSIRLLYKLDKANKFRLTTGLDYYFLRGRQRNQYELSAELFSHNTDLRTVVLGTEYSVLEYPPGDARIYVGLEGRGSFIDDEPITQKFVRHSNQEMLDERKGFAKDNAFRLGGAVRLGMDGELYAPLYVNTSVAYGVINLLGRNHSRGELLTPDNSQIINTESHEGYIHNLLVSFLLQYRFYGFKQKKGSREATFFKAFL